MKYIFFGTPEFAAIILEKLIEAGMLPTAVVCNPDKPLGRKRIVTPPPTKEIILRQGLLRIDVLQPEKIDEDFLIKLRSCGADFFIVAAYAKILPGRLFTIPRLGVIGVHPSLLPKLRGSSPIQSAILEGDAQTGVTLYLLDEKVDHGPIIKISNLKSQISKLTYGELNRKLAELAADLLIETLPKFIKGEITPLLQNEGKATFTKKFKTEDAYIEHADLEKAQNEGGQIALEIDRKIRAFNPEPGVWMLLNPAQITSLIRANGSMSNSIKNTKRMKILEAVLTTDGKLKLKKIQFEGKQPTSFSQYQKPLS